MSNWALQAGGAAETVGVTTTSISVDAGAVANTKGLWTEIIAATARDAHGFILYLGISGARDYLVDIGIGPALGEVAIAENLTVSQGLQWVQAVYQLPIPIPAGTRIVARAQATTASVGARVVIVLLNRGWNPDYPGGRVTTYGAVTADSGGTPIDPGATANTKGAWSELTASTTAPIRWLLLAVGNQVNTARESAVWLIDVGIGPVGSETVVIADLTMSCSTAGDTMIPVTHPPLPVAIPAGTRIAVRAKVGITDPTDRTFDAFCYAID